MKNLNFLIDTNTAWQDLIEITVEEIFERDDILYIMKEYYNIDYRFTYLDNSIYITYRKLYNDIKRHYRKYGINCIKIIQIKWFNRQLQRKLTVKQVNQNKRKVKI